MRDISHVALIDGCVHLLGDCCTVVANYPGWEASLNQACLQKLTHHCVHRWCMSSSAAGGNKNIQQHGSETAIVEQFGGTVLPSDVIGECARRKKRPSSHTHYRAQKMDHAIYCTSVGKGQFDESRAESCRGSQTGNTASEFSTAIASHREGT